MGKQEILVLVDLERGRTSDLVGKVVLFDLVSMGRPLGTVLHPWGRVGGALRSLGRLEVVVGVGNVVVPK